MAARYRFLVILGLSVTATSIMGCSKSEVSAAQGGTYREAMGNPAFMVLAAAA